MEKAATEHGAPSKQPHIISDVIAGYLIPPKNIYHEGDEKHDGGLAAERDCLLFAILSFANFPIRKARSFCLRVKLIFPYSDIFFFDKQGRSGYMN